MLIDLSIKSWRCVCMISLCRNVVQCMYQSRSYQCCVESASQTANDDGCAQAERSHCIKSQRWYIDCHSHVEYLKYNLFSYNYIYIFFCFVFEILDLGKQCQLLYIHRVLSSYQTRARNSLTVDKYLQQFACLEQSIKTYQSNWWRCWSYLSVVSFKSHFQILKKE